jgi:hypothetical protein
MAKNGAMTFNIMPPKITTLGMTTKNKTLHLVIISLIIIDAEFVCAECCICIVLLKLIVANV